MRKYNLLKFGCVVFLLCSAYQITDAQDFNEIVPMKSTCQDVERVFGGEHCGKEEETLTLPKERVRIAYSTKKCEKFYGKYWNIPIGTVVIIQRSILKPVTLEDLGMKINESEYVKNYTDIIGQVIYDKKTGEIGFSVIGGYVDRIVYFPSNADKSKLLCRKSKKRLVKKI